MASPRGSYPHPVLDPVSDDVAGTFDLFNASVRPGVEDVELSFQIRMTEPQIQELLDRGAAKYSFRWKCSSTIDGGSLDGATATPMADSTKYTAWIDQRRIRRNVIVEVRIIAAQEIPDYRLDAQHPDYGSATFHLMPGDVMADAGSFEFDPAKRFDPLQPPVGSCFLFAAKDGLAKGLEVDFSHDEHVLVLFPPDRYTEFGSLTDRPDLQISLAVLPALMEAITFIREQDQAGSAGEDLTDMRWATVIRELVAGVGTMDDRPLHLAQRILENPIDRTLALVLQPEEDDL